jgi:hypothetical protein|eukprot:COSAG01_NODE_2314_length_7932_cov_16.817439_2_plen_93_part_00
MRSLLLAVLGATCITFTQAGENLGVVFNDGSPAAPVQLDVFVDLLCEDCGKAYPEVQEAAKQRAFTCLAERLTPELTLGEAVCLQLGRTKLR